MRRIERGLTPAETFVEQINRLLGLRTKQEDKKTKRAEVFGDSQCEAFEARRAGAFSLAEAMITLLMVSIILAVMAPIISKKMKLTQTGQASIPKTKRYSVVYDDPTKNGTEENMFRVPMGVEGVWVTVIGGGASGGSSTFGSKIVTADERDWIVPDGVTSLRIYMVGGGGGGASGGAGVGEMFAGTSGSGQQDWTSGGTYSWTVPSTAQVPALPAACTAAGISQWTLVSDVSKKISPGGSLVKVWAVGGGGGAGKDVRCWSTQNYAGGGGGSGGYIVGVDTAIPNSSVTIRVGGGGGSADCSNGAGVPLSVINGRPYGGGGGGCLWERCPQKGGYGSSPGASAPSGYGTCGSVSPVHSGDAAGGKGGGIWSRTHFSCCAVGPNGDETIGGSNGGSEGGGGAGTSACGISAGGGGASQIVSGSQIVAEVGGGGGGGGRRGNEGGCDSGRNAGGGGGGGGKTGGKGGEPSLSPGGVGGVGGSNGSVGSGGSVSTIWGSSYGKGADSYIAKKVQSAGNDGAVRISWSNTANTLKCSYNMPANGSGGGGGGQVWYGELGVTPNQKFHFVVGKGGARQANSGANGNDGTYTNMQSDPYAFEVGVQGGKGGKYTSDNAQINNTYGTGAGLHPNLWTNWMGVPILGGQNGVRGSLTTEGYGGGAGGTNYLKSGIIVSGGAAGGVQGNGGDAPPTNYGAGGGGGGGVRDAGSTPGIGGAGAPGYIYIEWGGDSNGGGGSSGQVIEQRYIKGLKAQEVINITVGTGGLNSDGNKSAFGTYLEAKGGLKGESGGMVSGSHGKGGLSSGPGSLVGGNGINSFGGDGGRAVYKTALPGEGLGGCGGNRTTGMCAGFEVASPIGKAGAQAGGGGGGGAYKAGDSNLGGKGGNGLVIVEWE